MPARSNLFQRLVAEIHQDFGQGWTVTESRMLKDIVTGELREVDIVGETTALGYSCMIGIEVRDRKRPADVTWLEGIAKKHDNLPTDKVAVWSSSGFTEPCLVKARFLGIETVKPGTIDGAPWARIARDLVGGSFTLAKPELEPFADVVLENGGLGRWECRRDSLLLQEGGCQHISVGAILEQIIKKLDIRTAVLDNASEGSKEFFAIYTPPFPCTVIGPEGVVGKLSRLVIGMKVRCETVPLMTKSALRTGTVTTLIEAIATDGTYQLVVRETESGSPSTTCSLKRMCP